MLVTVVFLEAVRRESDCRSVIVVINFMQERMQLFVQVGIVFD